MVVDPPVVYSKFCDYCFHLTLVVPRKMQERSIVISLVSINYLMSLTPVMMTMILKPSLDSYRN